MKNVYIHPAGESWVDAVAAAVAESIHEAVAARGRCSIALCGGRTPGSVYARLAAPPYRDALPWGNLHVFWGDERWVPCDDAESNYRLAHEAWLSQVPLPPEQAYAVYRAERTPDQAAQHYAELLSTLAGSDDGPPRLDLALQGMGADGHTAAIYPGTEAAAETARWVVATVVPKPPPQRVTMTLPLLQTARRVMFLITTEEKADTLQRVLDDGPAAGVPAGTFVGRQHVEWWLDEPAASQLHSS